MAFSQDPAIVYGVGPGRFQKGEIPLMFTLWFKPEAKDHVDQLVDEFTKLAQRNPGDAEPQAEQPGAGQPSTKPADKVPAEAQTPTPTPKDAPR